MAKHQSREFWVGHVEAARSSGLTRAAYCRHHGLSVGSLARWARKLSRSANAPGFMIPIAVARDVGSVATGVVEVAVGLSVRLRVPSSVDARWLGRVLRDAAGC